MAIENVPFIGDIPIKSSIDTGFSIAMFDYQRVYPLDYPTITASHHYHIIILKKTLYGLPYPSMDCHYQYPVKKSTQNQYFSGDRMTFHHPGNRLMVRSVGPLVRFQPESLPQHQSMEKPGLHTGITSAHVEIAVEHGHRFSEPSKKGMIHSYVTVNVYLRES